MPPPDLTPRSSEPVKLAVAADHGHQRVEFGREWGGLQDQRGGERLHDSTGRDREDVDRAVEPLELRAAALFEDEISGVAADIGDVPGHQHLAGKRPRAQAGRHVQVAAVVLRSRPDRFTNVDPRTRGDGCLRIALLRAGELEVHSGAGGGDG